MTKVIYYTTINEQSPPKTFIESLNELQQRKIARIITNIQEYGMTTVIPHIKKLTGANLWEIRILGQDNIRLFYIIVLVDSILILHGFIKKKTEGV